MLTYERLAELLAYDATTGLFTWRVSRGTRKAGAVAGTPLDGYVSIGLDGKTYKGHRLAWLYVKGEWPAFELDHWDTDKMNNRFANIRPATRGQNVANCGRRTDNRSGFKGVRQKKGCATWEARIRHKGKLQHLGSYATPEAAHEAYCTAAERLHGEFANHG